MKRAAIALTVMIALAAGAVAVTRHARLRSASRGGEEEWIIVAEEPFEVLSDYEGELAARKVVTVASKFNGGATIVELAGEGQRVSRGDRLVRFDSFQVENDLLRLEREHAVAESELRNLEHATLPLELREIETLLIEARYSLGAERQYLVDTRDLVREGLVSESEVEKQNLKVSGLQSKIEQIELRLRLLKEHVHPARREEAHAKRDAAARQLELMRGQLAQCVVTSPCDGEVVYLSLPFGTELRPVRVGDTVLKNQEFLCIPDPSEWVVRCDIPEHELARVSPGMEARMTPKAWPDITLTGVVESVSAMARSLHGRPGERWFPVTVRVEGAPPALKSGLSVHVRIVTRRLDRAVLIPRAAVRWDEGRPGCVARGANGPERRALDLGPGNERFFEVRAGLRAGDQVRP